MVGRPFDAAYKGLVSGNLLADCSVKLEDIKNSNVIFGPDVAALKGKTTRPKAPAVRQNIIALPPIIRENHSNVGLVADLIFVNRIPFLITLSQKIGFGSLQFLRQQTGVNLLKVVKHVVYLYKAQGLDVAELYMD